MVSATLLARRCGTNYAQRIAILGGCQQFGIIARLRTFDGLCNGHSAAGHGKCNKQQNSQCSRSYHTTARSEIVPLLVGGAIVGLVGRYSYKALRRMNEEWEDYQWELRQYEKAQRRSEKNDSTVRTLSVDLGTVYMKLACSYPKPEVWANREGERAFFNGIIPREQGGDNSGSEDSLRGRQALEKFYYDDERGECPVILPWKRLQASPGTHQDTYVGQVLTPLLEDALTNFGYNQEDDSPMQFRSVVTVPTPLIGSHALESALNDIAPTYVPDPVAALWGAQAMSLAPDDKKDAVTMVVDVGGWITQLSIVRSDKVESTITLPWGSERFIQLLVGLLQPDDEPLTDSRSLAALQTQARTGVSEMATKTRIDIHVPYLFADPSKHHLDESVSRSVFEQHVNHDIRDRLSEEAQSMFSPHMPKPSDVQSLLASTMTQLLENGQLTPTQLDQILVVGGGARASFVEPAIQGALFALTGSSDKLLKVERALLPDLTVLGASSMLPTYSYSLDDGLYRN